MLGASVADLEDLRQGDVGMAGLFLDHGDAGRFGKRFAARQLRYASAAAGISPPTGPRGRCLDLGDVNVFPLQPAMQEQALRRQLQHVIAAGAMPIVVGGRGLPFDLGECLDRGRTVHVVGAPIIGMDASRIALVVDLTSLVGAKAEPRGLTRLLRALIAIPAAHIGAVHLCGVAPDLDVGGRHESSLAVHVLEALAAHLVGGAPCR
ncbi:MAG: arginase family protein [Gammaproteobacteria bacterium]|nr:arginase family protein [Gammaproteobacteria bacterium]